MTKLIASLLSVFLLALACSDDDESDGGGGSGGSSGSAGSGGDAGSAGSGTTAGSGGAAGNGAGGSAGGGQSGAGGGMSGSGGSANEADAGDDPDASGGDGDTTADGTMTFFVTSDGIGNGGDLGGIEGADAFCLELAVAADADFARRTWRAYLSATNVDAGERIGTGPWHNQAGEIIANDLTQLHDQGETGTLNDTWPIADLTVPLDEEGNQVANGVHDILTGTQADGTLDVGLTCEDWTTDEDDPAIDVRVGHSNRTGGAA